VQTLHQGRLLARGLLALLLQHATESLDLHTTTTTTQGGTRSSTFFIRQYTTGR
jgi:hypothetical protein